MYKQKPIDMKTRHNLLLAAALCLMCCAACTDAADDIADGTAPTPVPFTFTAVPPPAMTNGDATTRTVPGRDAWKGDGTEKIRVLILKNDISGDIFSEGIYTITSPEGDVEVLPGDLPAFWPDKQGKYQVGAIYPVKDQYQYDITDQSTPEKFREADIVVAGLFDVTPGSIPRMEFMHTMTKVRVELTGADPSAGDIQVGILGYSQFRFPPKNANWEPVGTETYITACRDTDPSGTPGVVAFEAMFFSYSQAITKQDFIRITIGSKTYRFTPGAGTPEVLVNGHVYTYRIAIPSSTTP